jgi:hypothetical protein
VTYRPGTILVTTGDAPKHYFNHVGATNGQAEYRSYIADNVGSIKWVGAC